MCTADCSLKLRTKIFKGWELFFRVCKSHGVHRIGGIRFHGRLH